MALTLPPSTVGGAYFGSARLQVLRWSTRIAVGDREDAVLSSVTGRRLPVRLSLPLWENPLLS